MCAFNTSHITDFVHQVEAVTGAMGRRVSREWRLPCVIHQLDGQRHNPSLAVWQRADGSVAYHCLAGCCHREVTAALKSMGVHVAKPVLDQQHRYEKMNRAKAEQSKQKARGIATAARVIEVGDACHKYLMARGIGLSTQKARFLRTNCSGTQLIGLISDPSTLLNETILLTGVQVLRLDERGTALVNSSGKKWRQTIGKLKGNGIVLGQQSHEMVLGEGIETTLAAMRLLRMEFGIAALSAGNMANVALPDGVRKLWVAQDNDESGINAGRRVAEKWRPRGVDVALVTCSTPGADAADEWLRRCRKAMPLDPQLETFAPSERRGPPYKDCELSKGS